MKTKIDIFIPVVESKKENSLFTKLRTHKIYIPARQIMNDIFNEMGDLDGNFVKDFQTTGFYQRIWELFLYEFLKENLFNIVRNHQYPDFEIERYSQTLFIEAVTSNASPQDKELDEKIENLEKIIDAAEKEKIQREVIEQYTIRIGSPLYSKLQKEYWKNDWVKGKPLLFAIEALHNKYSRFFPDYKMIEYLYGKQAKTKIDEKGILQSNTNKISEHKFNGKIIPSGLFYQENAENISAVIFANTSNIDKFNIMGLQKGYGNESMKIVRCGLKYSPNSQIADEFEYIVEFGDKKEKWSDGVSIFHNPNTLQPIDKELFKGIRQLWLTNGNYDGEIPNFYPYNSLTGTVLIDGKTAST